VAADEIFVLVLVAVCAGALIAMAVNSRRQKREDVGTSPAEPLPESPVPDARRRPNHVASGESAEPKGWVRP
jgi:hypothetical protein